MGTWSEDALGKDVACEIIARLKGFWGIKNAYSEAIDKWVESSNFLPVKELSKQAIAAIDRILGADSELQELWDEDGKNERWHFEMNDLRLRISKK